MLAGKRKKNSLNCLKQCEKPIGLNGTRRKSADEQKQSKKNVHPEEIRKREEIYVCNM